MGMVLSGSSETPISSDFVLDLDRQKVSSIKNLTSRYRVAFGENAEFDRREGVQGASLNVGVEIFCPDLDFQIMGLFATGKILPTDTTEPPEV